MSRYSRFALIGTTTSPARRRSGVLVAGFAVLALGLGACTQEGQEGQGGQEGQQQEQPDQQEGQQGQPEEQPGQEQEQPDPGGSAIAGSHSATLAPPEQAEKGFTYDQEAAPAGATMAVTIEGNEQSTTANLDVTGLQPDRGYAVHAHVNPCGPTGDAAGPHFQNNVDPAATPESPSTDPAYANPENEIWLDVQTDAQGAGRSTAEVPFGFTDRAPRSVVIHEHPRTATEPGHAGEAGGRLACLTLSED